MSQNNFKLNKNQKKNNTPNIFFQMPVTILLITTIIVLSCLYFTNAIKSVVCQKDLLSVFISNAIHLDIGHLLSNLYTFYSISHIEQKIGSKKFTCLVLFILVVSSSIEASLHKMTDKINCSVGMSSLLFGLIAWEKITTNKLDLKILSSIILMATMPSLKNSKISLIGHIIGALTGIISGVLYTKIKFD